VERKFLQEEEKSYNKKRNIKTRRNTLTEEVEKCARESIAQNKTIQFENSKKVEEI